MSSNPNNEHKCLKSDSVAFSLKHSSTDNIASLTVFGVWKDIVCVNMEVLL